MATKFTELSVDERIELVGDLWDSIIVDQAELVLTGIRNIVAASRQDMEKSGELMR